MKLSRWCPLVASISAVFLTTISTTANANDNWWFDVEVIAFKRNVALTELEEQFSLADNLKAPRAQADIISDVITPDISYLKQGLAVCGADTAIKWPNDSLFKIPSKDVDFLSLSAPSSAQNSGESISAQSEDTPPVSSFEEVSSTYNSASNLAADTSSRTEYTNTQSEKAFNKQQNNTSYSSSMGYTSSADYLYEEDTAGDAPDAATIASYWTSFFGAKHTASVTVPTFKYCEESKPWLSAEVTTVLNLSAPAEKEVSANAMQDDYTSKASALKSAARPAIVWKVNKPDNRLPAPASLPIIVEGHDWPLASKAHLLTSNQQALSSISRQIRSNRELERLFHATWRQPVMFGKNKAFSVRLYGGQNYAQQFDLNGDMLEHVQSTASINQSHNDKSKFGYDATADASANNMSNAASKNNAYSPISTSENMNIAYNTSALSDSDLASVPDIFADLDRRLSNPDSIDYEAFKALETAIIVQQDEGNGTDVALRTPIWEIDGTIKVFLKYINRVPYLHVDGEMFYRQPVPLSYFSSEESNATLADEVTPTEYKLVSVPLAEQRRVISTQLHYFDHPLFGFVVQIRRYNRPSVSE